MSVKIIARDHAPAGLELRPLDENPIPVDEFSAAGREPDRPHLNSLKQFMKTSLLIVAASIALASLAPAAQTELKDQKDKVSYSIGLDIGTTLKRQLIDVNAELLNKGIQDGLSGNKALLTDEQMKETMAAFQKDMMAKQAAAKKATGEKNAAEGKNTWRKTRPRKASKPRQVDCNIRCSRKGPGRVQKRPIR